jgi:hypothetical protein
MKTIFCVLSIFAILILSVNQSFLLQVNAEDEDKPLFEDKYDNSTSEDFKNKYCPPDPLVYYDPPCEPEE